MREGMTLAVASSINVAAGVVGVVIWPVWFGMDFKDAAGKEALPEALAAIAAEGIDHVFAVMGDANQDIIVELCEKHGLKYVHACRSRHGGRSVYDCPPFGR
jgi:hypothetical protein